MFLDVSNVYACLFYLDGKNTLIIKSWGPTSTYAKNSTKYKYWGTRTLSVKYPLIDSLWQCNDIKELWVSNHANFGLRNGSQEV